MSPSPVSQGRSAPRGPAPGHGAGGISSPTVTCAACLRPLGLVVQDQGLTSPLRPADLSQGAPRGSRGQRVGSQVESAGWVLDKRLFEYQTETFRLGRQGQPTGVGKGGEAAGRQGARPAPRRTHPVGTRPLGAQSAGVPTQGRQQQPHKHPRPRMGTGGSSLPCGWRVAAEEGTFLQGLEPGQLGTGRGACEGTFTDGLWQDAVWTEARRGRAHADPPWCQGCASRGC